MNFKLNVSICFLWSAFFLQLGNVSNANTIPKLGRLIDSIKDDQYRLCAPVFTAAPLTTFDMKDNVGKYITEVKDNWLLKVPYTNPALLDMFAVRDVQPYKNYLPWSGEFAGKYLTGATLMLKLTKDPQLKISLQKFVNKLISLQDKTDGYLGPFKFTDRLTGWDSVTNNYTWEQWNHNHLITGLLYWYEETGDVQALACASKIGDMMCKKFLKTPMISTTYRYSTDMNQSLIYGMTRLYQKTGAKKYLDLAEAIVKEFELYDLDNEQAGDYVRQANAGKEFYLTPRARWESLVTLTGIAELYYITGNERYKKTLQNFWWSILKTDRHNNGGFSTAEGALGNPYDPGAIETCATVAWVSMSVDMLKMTGNSIVADELELSTLNQVLGYQSPDGLWCTYNTPMDGKRLPGLDADVAFQRRPGSEEINCCSANAPSGFGYIAEWALMQDKQGLILNWYGPSTMRSIINGTPVELVQKTSYPSGGDIQLTVNPESAKAFELKLRIPYWSANSIVTVNGSKVKGVSAGKYLLLNRKWKPGDRIEISLDMSLRYWKGQRNYVGKSSIYHGPLLLVLEDEYPQLKFIPNEQWERHSNIRATNKSGSIVSCTFSGTNITLEGKRFDDAGMAKVEIDGVFETNIDQYHPVRNTTFEWSKSGLPNKIHTLKITTLAQKNPASSGYWVNIDQVRSGHQGPKTKTYLQGDSYAEYRQHEMVLDARTLTHMAKVVTDSSALKAQVILEIKQAGKILKLRDYGTAGTDRKQYYSWLTVQNTFSAPFSQNNPGRSWRP